MKRLMKISECTLGKRIDMKEKTVTILGWYGSGNAGDEAMLSAVINCVRNVAPSCMINVLSINPYHTARTHNVNNAVHRSDKSSILSLLFKTKLFVLGGGGLLKPNSAKIYSRFLFLFKTFGARTMTYGVGAIPLLSPVERLTTQVALRFCDVITVRDLESKEVLKAMGIDKPIYVTADPVFSLTVKTDAEPSLESLKRIEKPYVAVCLRHWQHEDLIHSGVHRFIRFDGFISVMAELCDVLVERGFEVLLVPMLVGERESDVDDLKALADRSKHKDRIHVIENQLSAMEIIELLRFAEITIGMRLHSLMFSVLATTPIVALSYAMKVKGFMKSIGLEKYCVDLRRLDERGLREAVFSAYKNKDMLRERLRKVVALQRRKARMNEKIVASLL